VTIAITQYEKNYDCDTKSGHNVQGFTVYSLWFKFWGLGFKFWVLGFTVYGFKV
jgi:hypothetical protein